MSTFVISGSASGMGAATAALLTSQGHEVIGIDLRDATITADLATAEGREQALAGVQARTARLDGVALFAGVAGATDRKGSMLPSLNYFGSVALFEGLRPLLAAAGESAAVALCSNSMTLQPGWSEELVQACLAGDEQTARTLADARDSQQAYPATKTALARWLRRSAPSADWAGAGIRLNAIAPGLVETPMTAAIRADEKLGALIDAFPLPLGRGADPREIAELVAFLLSDRARFFCGSIVLVDGGSEAVLRPDVYPTRWDL